LLKKSQIVNIENQKVKITNLDKIIYPSAGVIKAEVIQYYLQIAPFLLNNISNRPLTLIRFPDGILKLKVLKSRIIL